LKKLKKFLNAFQNDLNEVKQDLPEKTEKAFIPDPVSLKISKVSNSALVTIRFSESLKDLSELNNSLINLTSISNQAFF
jgi:hypothetical protein